MKWEAIQESRGKHVFSGAFQPAMVDFNHRSKDLNLGPACVAATFGLPSAVQAVRYSTPSGSSAIPIFDNRYRSAFRESPSNRAA
jgi:hypothetical protein